MRVGPVSLTKPQTNEDNMDAITRMKNAVKIREQINEVAAGVRGFVSCSRIAKTSGIPKESVAKWATSSGLVGKNHGKYGLCFSK